MIPRCSLPAKAKEPRVSGFPGWDVVALLLDTTNDYLGQRANGPRNATERRFFGRLLIQ